MHNITFVSLTSTGITILTSSALVYLLLTLPHPIVSCVSYLPPSLLTLPYTTLPFTTLLHITLTFHCTTLQYTTLHCTTHHLTPHYPYLPLSTEGPSNTPYVAPLPWDCTPVVIEKKFERRVMYMKDKPEEPTRERETDPKVGKSSELRPWTLDLGPSNARQ